MSGWGWGRFRRQLREDPEEGVGGVGSGVVLQTCSGVGGRSVGLRRSAGRSRGWAVFGMGFMRFRFLPC